MTGRAIGDATRRPRKLPLAFVAVLVVIALVTAVWMVSERTRHGEDEAATTRTAAPLPVIPIPDVEPITLGTRPSEAEMADIRAQLDAVFGSSRYAVLVADAADGTVRVDIDSNEAFTAASTYKLFTAYSMASAVETGAMSWDTTLAGNTLAGCMETMLVDSDNTCPVAWLTDVVGNAGMTTQTHALGATSTFWGSNQVTTTATDLTLVLQGYYRGSLLSADSTTRILSLLERQRYRDGIPAGMVERGVTQVADKVGFLGGFLHDAGIVYTPKGDFTFVIMTEGSSWDAIAEAAAVIYDAL